MLFRSVQALKDTGCILHEHLDNTSLHHRVVAAICSHDTWIALLLLLCDGGKYFPDAHGECNQYLSKIGLEVISIVKVPDECIIQVAMKLTDM